MWGSESRRSLGLAALGMAIMLVVAACGSGDEEVAEPAAEPVAESPTEEPREPGDDADGPGTTAAGWMVTDIGDGSKPDLALDASGRPAIAFMLEALEGGIWFADAASDWTVDEAVRGYFYGPIGLDFDGDDVHIAYHDHQDRSFQPSKGDLTLASRVAGSWQDNVAADDGHDGWDSTITIAEEGVIRAAGVDPSQFGSVDGVEYYEFRDGVWQVESVGSGPVAYEFNVSLAVTPDGRSALTYFNDGLFYAERTDAGWQIEPVVESPEMGKFSSLAFDADGVPHISFFEEGSGTGQVMYATRVGDQWQIEDVVELGDVVIGMTGARRNSALAIGPDGTLMIAASDRQKVTLSTRTESGFATEDVLLAENAPLGQQVALAVDNAGIVHLATFDVTDANPSGISGNVLYLTNG